MLPKIQLCKLETIKVTKTVELAKEEENFVEVAVVEMAVGSPITPNKPKMTTTMIKEREITEAEENPEEEAAERVSTRGTCNVTRATSMAITHHSASTMRIRRKKRTMRQILLKKIWTQIPIILCL